MTVSLVNSAISALDTPSSLLPFFVKDSFDITGRTIMAKNEGGRHEAREKLIEEAGTSAFWIGGIPAVRAIVNLMFKGKIDTKIHFKRINQDGIQNYYADQLEEKVVENGKEITKKKFQDLKGIELGGKKIEAIHKKLEENGYKVNGKKGLYKTFHVGATAAAVVINLVILMIALPKFNQYLSRVIISKEEKEKQNQPNAETKFGSSEKVAISNFLKTKDTAKNDADKTSFGSFASSIKESFSSLFKFSDLIDFPTQAEKAQLNPQTSMLLLDYGISGARVTVVPRNNNERIENAVKEGGIIFFFYFASEVIKTKLAQASDKFLNLPIDLDYKIMKSKEFLAKLKAPHKKAELLNFAEMVDKDEEVKKVPNATKEELEAVSKKVAETNEVSVIRMIDKELVDSSLKTNPEDFVFKNFTLQMAKEEGLIKLEKDESLGKLIRNSKAYIETEKVIKLNGNLKNFYDKTFDKINKSNLTLENILSKTKKAKIAAVFGNMVICCASLSFILPKIQYAIREYRTKTKSAPGIKLYQDLAAKNELVV